MAVNFNAFFIAFQLLSCIKSETKENGKYKLISNYIEETEILCRWTCTEECDISCTSIDATKIKSLLENLFKQVL